MKSLRVLYLPGIFTKLPCRDLWKQVHFATWRLESSRVKRVDMLQDVSFQTLTMSLVYGHFRSMLHSTQTPYSVPSRDCSTMPDVPLVPFQLINSCEACLVSATRYVASIPFLVLL